MIILNIKEGNKPMKNKDKKKPQQNQKPMQKENANV